jgi:hypothetical protein
MFMTLANNVDIVVMKMHISGRTKYQSSISTTYPVYDAYLLWKLSIALYTRPEYPVNKR